MKIKISFLAIFSVLILSCNRSKSIEGFDQKLWKEDMNACKNLRVELVKVLLIKKEELKQFDDDAMIDLLGTPDKIRQFARGEKNYIYFVQSGSQCSEKTSSVKEGKKLVIEFDSVGEPKIIRESLLDR